MSEFNEKFKEYESKKKKSNRNLISIIIAGLIIFTTLFLYNIYVKKQKSIDNKLFIERSNEQIKLIEIKDSILYTKSVNKEDSIKKALKQIKIEIAKIKQASENNLSVIQQIDSLQSKVDKVVITLAVDTIIVRYYKRKADGNSVEKTVSSIKSPPNYYLHIREASNDDGSNTVNTMYYGKNLKQEYVDILYKKLLKNDINITQLKPFLSARGFEWKGKAIEIGYEKSTSTTEENAKLFVRIYSYNPIGKDKYVIRNKIEAKGFQTKLFPDWRDKPSFFSDQSTVLYYHRSMKNKADDIARVLTKVTSIKFITAQGAGYGVSAPEKKTLFIVHYNGSK